MITDLIVTAFLACIDAVFSLIPTFDAPTLVSADSVSNYGMQFSRIVAIEWLLACCVISLGIILIMQVIDLAFFLYHQFWGAS